MAEAFDAVRGFFISCFAFIFSLSTICSPVFGIIKSGGKDAMFEDWSASQTYTSNYAAEIEKDPNEDFVVLNITDVQLSFPNAYSEEGELAENTINELVDRTNPDLITMTGDNAWSVTTYLRVIKFLDSFGIPWAPVMGNHDGQGAFDEFWCAYQLANAKNCLFKFGPKDMGFGNYVVNITEKGRVVHSLIMMDTHSGAEDTEASAINAKNGDYGYDHLWANQIEWYKWVVNGIKAQNGKTVYSTVFFHIPCCEYVDAMKLTSNIEYNDEGALVFKGIKPEYQDTTFGANHENLCCPTGNNGFFNVAKELGSTKEMVAGHDHVNSLSAVYQGIRLTYGVKTGSGCYWEEDMSGGTVISIDSNGVSSTHHEYVKY